jgi:hypothetical protein
MSFAFCSDERLNLFVGLVRTVLRPSAPWLQSSPTVGFVSGQMFIAILAADPKVLTQLKQAEPPIVG